MKKNQLARYALMGTFYTQPISTEEVRDSVTRSAKIIAIRNLCNQMSCYEKLDLNTFNFLLCAEIFR